MCKVLAASPTTRAGPENPQIASCGPVLEAILNDVQQSIDRESEQVSIILNVQVRVD